MLRQIHYSFVNVLAVAADATLHRCTDTADDGRTVGDDCLPSHSVAVSEATAGLCRAPPRLLPLVLQPTKMLLP